VLGPNLAAVEQARLFLGLHENLSCSIGESLEHPNILAGDHW
jgi:hypothetical protein